MDYVSTEAEKKDQNQNLCICFLHLPGWTADFLQNVVRIYTLGWSRQPPAGTCGSTSPNSHAGNAVRLISCAASHLRYSECFRLFLQEKKKIQRRFRWKRWLIIIYNIGARGDKRELTYVFEPFNGKDQTITQKRMALSITATPQNNSVTTQGYKVSDWLSRQRETICDIPEANMLLDNTSLKA